jgi:predicted CopG family antitoxin
MPKAYHRTTILIDGELWKRFRIKAMNENKSASELLVEMIKKKLDEKR